METKLLPKGFFKSHPLEEISAAKIAYVSMTVSFDAAVDGAIAEMAEKGIQGERHARIEDEKRTIEQLDSGDAIVAFMRSRFDIANQQRLCRKALSMQAEVIPLMLRRYRTSFQDVFIDTAVYILARGEQAYVEQLKAMYHEIRNPYAKSLACLVFGVRQDQSTVPLLLAEYERMKKDYPEENLCQGPLLALYILYGKA